MTATRTFCRPARGITIGALAAVATAALALPTAALRAQAGSEPAAEAGSAAEAEPHMPEALRSAIGKVVVIATRGPAGEDLTGTYGKDTPGLIGGMDQGSRIGRIRKEVGPVPVYIPIPILTIPGAIFGGLSGATKRQIQEFRDALTEDLVNAESPTLTDDGLALDVFWGIRKLPKLESKIQAPTVPLPADTDAVLYVVFGGVEIDVQGKEAIITTSAEAAVRGVQSGRELYAQTVYYRDRDTLSEWTKDDNALWRDYTNYARHYLGREVSDEVFGRIELEQDLAPVATDTARRDRKNEREFVSRTTTPTLAWELLLAGGEGYAEWSLPIDEADIFYDLEIYDARQLVYAEENIPDPRHTLLMELEDCRTYRWSVRPSFRRDGDLRYGQWLRFAATEDDDEKNDAEGVPKGQGLSGRQASAAPAYTQDFPSLKIECGRR